MLAFVALQTGMQPHLTRDEFAVRCHTVQPGMSKEKVRELLGPPDERWTFADPKPFHNPYEGERWGWGTNGHFTFATCGTVQFGVDGMVISCLGPLLDKEGAVLPPLSFLPARWKDTEIQSILRSLYSAEYPEGPFSNRKSGPLEFIRATNLLIPLGEAKAISALREYEALSKGSSRVFPWILIRCLYIPRARPITMSMPSTITLQPEIFADPLGASLQLGLTIGSLFDPDSGPSIVKEVEELRSECRFRTESVVPAADPIEAVDQLAHSSLGQTLRSALYNTTGKQESSIWQMIVGQIRDLLRSAVDPNTPNIEAFRGRVKWDARRQCYVALDGSVRPFNLIKRPPPRIALELPEVRLNVAWLAAERSGPSQVGIVVAWSRERKVKAKFEIFDEDYPDLPLTTFSIPPAILPVIGADDCFSKEVRVPLTQKKAALKVLVTMEGKVTVHRFFLTAEADSVPSRNLKAPPKR